jgi:drug/metabolite transporter (DMT)-like permease
MMRGQAPFDAAKVDAAFAQWADTAQKLPGLSFDYTSMLCALLLGYWLFGELPDTLVYVGGAIVAAADLFVI